MATTKGYKADFIGTNLPVAFPKLNASQKKDIAPVTGSTSGEITFPHFSVVLCRSRKFPFFSAANINGDLFKKVTRKSIFPGGRDVWKVDTRAKAHQWDNDLYVKAPHSDFDRGHMTKREDPQWGNTKAEAKAAAKSTFHFCNCAPQLSDLNQKEWKLLEDYILEKESVPGKLLINVFTGPVLKTDDPVFVSKVNNEDVLIPTLFWKVIYYSNDGKKLSKVGFLMGQENLLKKRKIVTTQRPEMVFAAHLQKEKAHFMEFKDAQTYQVNLASIEKLSGLKFPAAKQPYKDKRPIPLVVEAVEMKEDVQPTPTAGGAASSKNVQQLNYANYRFKGIVLR